MTWSTKDIDKLKAKGLTVNGENSKGPEKDQKKTRIPKPEAKGLIFLKRYLMMRKIEFVTEHRFHDVRMFRFDIAIPSMMLAIEYEGLFSQKSGHTTANGFISDCEKYNLAQLSGWTVLRYTAKTYETFPVDLEFIFDQDKLLTT